MRKGIFDFNEDGELDVFEQAAEMQFIDEVILAKEESEPECEFLDNSEREFLIDPPRQQSARRKRGAVTGISFMGKPFYDARKDSTGVTLLKSLAVIALCIGGFALPIAADMGELGMLICMFGGVGLSMLILKNT